MTTGSYGRLLAFTALLGCLVAANAPVFSSALFGLYAYWVARLVIEAGLLIAFRMLVESFAPKLSFWQTTAATVVVSLLPFVLIVTAMDIILGLPELEIGTETASGPRIGAFALELLYLFDNHIVLGVLLALASRLQMVRTQSEVVSDAPPAATSPALLANLDPPLSAPVLWIEAQEHYVRLKTQIESRLVLNRFSDIVGTLPEAQGMQVHRSHWVAFAAVESAYRDGANLRLKLSTGDSVPVSRSYRQAVTAAIGDKAP